MTKKKTPDPYGEMEGGNLEPESNPENPEEGQEQQPPLNQGKPPMSQEEAETIFDQQSAENKQREVDLPPVVVETEGGESGGLPKTLGETIEDSSDMTDMQYSAHRLFPPKLGDSVSNANMIGRVDPNVYLARLHLNAENEIMMSDPEKDIDVNSIWNKHEVLLSIGLDGMGRIDLLELSGAAREEKRIDKQFGLLGTT